MRYKDPITNWRLCVPLSIIVLHVFCLHELVREDAAE